MGSADAFAASLPIAAWGPGGAQVGRQLDGLATSPEPVAVAVQVWHLGGGHGFGPHLDRSHVSVSVPCTAMMGTVCKKQRYAHC